MIIQVTRLTNATDGSLEEQFFGVYHSIEQLIKCMPPRFVNSDGLPICPDVVYTFCDALRKDPIDDPRPVRLHDRKAQAYDGRYFARLHQAFRRSRQQDEADLATYQAAQLDLED